MLIIQSCRTSGNPIFAKNGKECQWIERDASLCFLETSCLDSPPWQLFSYRMEQASEYEEYSCQGHSV